MDSCWNFCGEQEGGRPGHRTQGWNAWMWNRQLKLRSDLICRSYVWCLRSDLQESIGAASARGQEWPGAFPPAHPQTGARSLRWTSSTARLTHLHCISAPRWPSEIPYGNTKSWYTAASAQHVHICQALQTRYLAVVRHLVLRSKQTITKSFCFRSLLPTSVLLVSIFLF